MAILKLWGVLKALDNTLVPLEETIHTELVMLLLSKMDSVNHKNVVMARDRDSAQKL